MIKFESCLLFSKRDILVAHRWIKNDSGGNSTWIECIKYGVHELYQAVIRGFYEIKKIVRRSYEKKEKER